MPPPHAKLGTFSPISYKTAHAPMHWLLSSQQYMHVTPWWFPWQHGTVPSYSLLFHPSFSQFVRKLELSKWSSQHLPIKLSPQNRHLLVLQILYTGFYSVPPTSCFFPQCRGRGFRKVPWNLVQDAGTHCCGGSDLYESEAASRELGFLGYLGGCSLFTLCIEDRLHLVPRVTDIK